MINCRNAFLTSFLALLLTQQSCYFGDAAPDAMAKRDAQNIASVYASSRVAGHDFSKGLTDPELIAEQVVKGHTIKNPSSPFDGSYFGLTLTPVKIQEASHYLQYDHTYKVIIYNPAPKPPLASAKTTKIENRFLALFIAGLMWLTFLVLALTHWKKEAN